MRPPRTILVGLAFASAAAVTGGGLAGAGSFAATPAGTGQAAAIPAARSSPARAHAGVDPRSGGFEIGLGEWAITTEARAIRPGRVTFVIRNRGKMTHGFEIELRIRREGDDYRVKEESIDLRPGRSTRMTLNLAPGVYEIECSVSNHDDMGMRGVLEVRENAPLVAPWRAGGRSAVQIVGFAFKPATLRTTIGRTVTWRNDDAAPHTATGKQFSSPQLRKGGMYRRRFTRAGTYTYVCALHPGMRGKIVVAQGGSR
jgi:plastocyanin